MFRSRGSLAPVRKQLARWNPQLSTQLRRPVNTSANSNGPLQYFPWSSQFRGSQGTKALLQAVTYTAVAIAVYDHLKSDSKAFQNSTQTQYGSTEDVAQAIKELREAFSDPKAVATDDESLKTYGSSEHSYHPISPHAVIVRPKSTDDVVRVINIARRYRIPVVPYSGATSLEGHFSGHPTGSICLDMSGMDQILRINVDDSDLTCQAGARWEDINETLKAKGIPLFFPLDPGPGATIGGMIGTGCSGTNAVRYGTARSEWFLSLTVVLPDGSVVKTRSRARKSAAGFDTTKLFIGAEGTLGIVTEATLRLAPVLPTKVAMAQFPSVQHAVSAVQEILNSPQGPHMQCIELLDDHMMQAINDAGFVDNPYPVSDTLFFKIQGDAPTVTQTSNVIQEVVKRHKGSNFKFASTDTEADELWLNRKYALMSSIAANPGYRCWTTDVCVPVSRLPQLVQETKEDLAAHSLRSTIVGHVGDGNFHALILFKDDKELQKVEEAVHRLVYRALALDGTCTGEHGVGLGKKSYLVDELGEETVQLMRKIKSAVDPFNILNPGKLYPDENSKKD
ncbi:D-lactate dehydrogenase cytochrome oxidoreductase [Coprinopsis cinerea okayama7|uniref:D-lactate dehydrogenase (cytochrome) n=1 Tax=Coprinopsis cinerea (strain Okayama-7 / 130 / ATCC MYA-4618 / FGSC 9003) TaxID=240176 RepID=A8NGA3_COPC7|nr:D-lactate dehydrogenase cytochrome oxidoreductase [Coprinopsis cinerea okayama7\|eukprot:XP_001833387.2 D-lactate dehydrogenase cytochrome oxidoreductase [Coprinopsis cinerea okayama7\